MTPTMQAGDGRDPEIQTPPEFQFYVQQHGVRKNQREFDRESLPGMRKSLTKAHDNLQRQVGINTRLYAQLTRAERALGWERIWRRILTAGLLVSWGFIGWIFKAFLEHFK